MRCRVNSIPIYIFCNLKYSKIHLFRSIFELVRFNSFKTWREIWLDREYCVFVCAIDCARAYIHVSIIHLATRIDESVWFSKRFLRNKYRNQKMKNWLFTKLRIENKIKKHALGTRAQQIDEDNATTTALNTYKLTIERVRTNPVHANTHPALNHNDLSQNTTTHSG